MAKTNIFPVYSQNDSQENTISDANNTTVVAVDARQLNLKAVGHTSSIDYKVRLEGPAGLVFTVKFTDDDATGGLGTTACDLDVVNIDGDTVMTLDAVNELAYVMFTDEKGNVLNMGATSTDGAYPKVTSSGVFA